MFSKVLTQQRDYQLLSKIFTRNVITEFAKSQRSPTLLKILNELGVCRHTLRHLSITDIFETSYNELVKKYRNEYIYKNAIATKIVKGKHKLANTTFVSEFKVGRSIGDVAVFNGTSTVYEIKSDYDSFDRLRPQLEAYSNVFDKIYVVTSNKLSSSVGKVIPDHVGIYELTNNYTLSLIKEAKSNMEQLKAFDIFNSLRPSEYLEIVQENFDYIPSKSPTQRKNECFELFSKMNSQEIHSEFVTALKRRQLLDYEKMIIKQLPDSLTSQLLSCRLNKRLLLSFEECIMRGEPFH